MDGLIIDSEPLWRKAEIAAFKEIGYDFTEQMCILTKGMRIDEVVSYWWNKLKWEAPSKKTVVNDIHFRMIELINNEGQILPGIIKTLKSLHNNNIPIALASSSSMNLINTVLNKLNIRLYFKVIHSAEDELAGKPDPAVFLSTSKLLKIEPSQCLVLEDSKAGMEAGINAGMRTILVPEKGTDPNWKINAYACLKSMNEFNIESLK